MARKQTYGYDRRPAVPALAGTVTKLCGHCDKFFAARGKERVCDGCVSEPERLRRQARDHYARLSTSTSQNRSESHTAGFSRTHPTTRKRADSPYAMQVSGMLSDRGALCRELALELAATLATGKGKPKADIGQLRPITRAEARAYTRRNVALGLQWKTDLERFAS